MAHLIYYCQHDIAWRVQGNTVSDCGPRCQVPGGVKLLGHRRPIPPTAERYLTTNPRWVRILTRLQTPEDRGIGDTVQRIAAKFGGERFKRFAKRIGLPCGCTGRQARWNADYPNPNYRG